MQRRDDGKMATARSGISRRKKKTVVMSQGAGSGSKGAGGEEGRYNIGSVSASLHQYSPNPTDSLSGSVQQHHADMMVSPLQQSDDA